MADVGSAVVDAVVDTAEDREFGTSEEDIEAYGAAGGAVAAAAACSATGVGAVAAPVCAYIGGEVGAAIADVCYNWFYDDEAARKARERRAAVHRMFQAQAAIRVLSTELGRTWQRMLDDLNTVHAELFKTQVWAVAGGVNVHPLQQKYIGAIQLMQKNGLMTKGRSGTEGITISLAPDLNAEWYRLMGLGVGSSRTQEELESVAEVIADSLSMSYNASVLELSGRAAGDWALVYAEAQAAEHPEVIQVSEASSSGGRPAVIQISESTSPEDVLPAVRSVPAHAPTASSRVGVVLRGTVGRWLVLCSGCVALVCALRLKKLRKSRT